MAKNSKYGSLYIEPGITNAQGITTPGQVIDNRTWLAKLLGYGSREYNTLQAQVNTDNQRYASEMAKYQEDYESMPNQVRQYEQAGLNGNLLAGSLGNATSHALDSVQAPPEKASPQEEALAKLSGIVDMLSVGSSAVSHALDIADMLHAHSLAKSGEERAEKLFRHQDYMNSLDELEGADAKQLGEYLQEFSQRGRIPLPLVKELPAGVSSDGSGSVDLNEFLDALKKSDGSVDFDKLQRYLSPQALKWIEELFDSHRASELSDLYDRFDLGRGFELYKRGEERADKLGALTLSRSQREEKYQQDMRNWKVAGDVLPIIMQLMQMGLNAYSTVGRRRRR